MSDRLQTPFANEGRLFSEMPGCERQAATNSLMDAFVLDRESQLFRGFGQLLAKNGSRCRQRPADFINQVAKPRAANRRKVKLPTSPRVDAGMDAGLK